MCDTVMAGPGQYPLLLACLLVSLRPGFWPPVLRIEVQAETKKHN